MANSNTTNYNLVEPEVGASADSWGDKLNTNMVLLDAGLSGIAANTINGLTLSTAGSSATFGIAAGNAGDSSGRLMTLATAYTKTTSSWAVGTAAGALDTGSISNNTWYHGFIIKRVDTGVVDILTSLSATAPTMPTNYTLKRRIGAMKTNGSAQWTLFSQNGDEFLWAAPVQDYAGAVPASSSAESLNLTAPTGVKANALFTFRYAYGSTDDFFLVTSPDQTNSSPSSGQYSGFVTSGFTDSVTAQNIRMSTLGQIRHRAIKSGGGSPTGAYSVFTRGWIDPRGKF